MKKLAAADAQRIGAINDLSIAAEFLQVALREIVQGTDPGSPEVRQWIDFALAKVQPIAAHASEIPTQPS
ncbi:hypothetical protein [Paenirhodobacter sp.]|uniref:hypothetical protein n=1 Tax=Paenirhodobacter sp. TaxID=1965326 RepID=UPI003B512435